MTFADGWVSAETGAVEASARDVVPADQRWIRWFAATMAGAWLFAWLLHRLDRVAFLLSGGRRTVTSALSGLPVIMLTTTGARTGLPRTVSVLGFPVHRDIAIAAGNFGRRQDPAWCLNLRREPRARIVVDGQVRHVVAEELAGERQRHTTDAGIAGRPASTLATGTGGQPATLLPRKSQPCRASPKPLHWYVDQSGRHRAPSGTHRRDGGVALSGAPRRRISSQPHRPDGSSYWSGKSLPCSSTGRGPKIRRSSALMATSLMLASRRVISPCSSNSHSSLP